MTTTHKLPSLGPVQNLDRAQNGANPNETVAVGARGPFLVKHGRVVKFALEKDLTDRPFWVFFQTLDVVADRAEEQPHRDEEVEDKVEEEDASPGHDVPLVEDLVGVLEEVGQGKHGQQVVVPVGVQSVLLVLGSAGIYIFKFKSSPG